MSDQQSKLIAAIRKEADYHTGECFIGDVVKAIKEHVPKNSVTIDREELKDLSLMIEMGIGSNSALTDIIKDWLDSEDV